MSAASVCSSWDLINAASERGAASDWDVISQLSSCRWQSSMDDDACSVLSVAESLSSVCTAAGWPSLGRRPAGSNDLEQGAPPRFTSYKDALTQGGDGTSEAPKPAPTLLSRRRPVQFVNGYRVTKKLLAKIEEESHFDAAEAQLWSGAAVATIAARC
eukprot:TRINITY_DN13736_c0_g1_i2.p1 TRINITY_DN13736_c0_g1~~TRINITY_DN13736_c0_g1_i2.p1  ORF type:complete len:176 (+),score=32.94 TRINITY_DN13736_c0_g1_i2:55-528(+)